MAHIIECAEWSTTLRKASLGELVTGKEEKKGMRKINLLVLAGQ